MDKGSAIGIMGKGEYISAREEVLSNKTSYEVLLVVHNLNYKEELEKIILEMKRKYH